MKEYLLKQRYYIEPNFPANGWILRKEGSDSIMKKAKYKTMLLYFAENILNKQKAELRICDSNGMLEEIIDFERMDPVNS
jgi:hypothetical protein